MTRIVWQRLDVPGLEWAEIARGIERVGDRSWRYRSAGFEAPVEVDGEGLVVTYGGYWQAVGREA